MLRSTLIRVAAAVTATVTIAVIGVATTATSATATQGQPVIAGQANSATDSTGLEDVTTNVPALEVVSHGAMSAAVIGWGEAVPAGVGVFGMSGFGSVSDYLPWAGDGVHGKGTLNGVSGETSNGTASGVYGQNNGTGFGVAGRAINGTGVLADSANGVALNVSGKAQFSRSGVVTINFPAKSAVVSGVPVTSKSLVLATIQKFLAGVYVVAAMPNLGGSSNSFTIYLNKAPGTATAPKSVTVGWYVVEHL